MIARFDGDREGLFFAALGVAEGDGVFAGREAVVAKSHMAPGEPFAVDSDLVIGGEDRAEGEASGGLFLKAKLKAAVVEIAGASDAPKGAKPIVIGFDQELFIRWKMGVDRRLAQVFLIDANPGALGDGVDEDAAVSRVGAD